MIRPPLVLAHHHPGRLRVRAETFRAGARGGSEPEPLVLAREALALIEGVRTAADPFTGSLLIEYVPGSVEPSALLATVAQAAGLGRIIDDVTARRNGPDLAAVVVRAARALDRTLSEVSGGRAGLNTLVPLALFAGAAVSLARQPDAPRWDNLFYWSYSLFRDLNRTTGDEPPQ